MWFTAAAPSAGRCASPRRERSSSPDRSRSVARSARSAPRQLKGSVLELGGKDPQIVCADADLGNAISGCVWGGFANAGQTCSGIERTYVVKEVADRFIEGVVRSAGELTVGDPLEWETEIGPMVSEEQFGTVSELVDDALANGAERMTGGPREVAGFSGKFIAPTVLAGVEDEMRIMSEEIFGPVVPIVVVDSEEEALRRANDSQLRAGRVGVDQGPRQGRANGAADRVGDGVDQRPLLHPRRLPVLVGRASRTRASAAPTRSSASTSASTSSWSPGSRGSPATSGGSHTTGRWARRCAPRRACSTAATGSGCKALREGGLASAAGRRPHPSQGSLTRAASCRSGVELVIAGEKPLRLATFRRSERTFDLVGMAPRPKIDRAVVHAPNGPGGLRGVVLPGLPPAGCPPGSGRRSVSRCWCRPRPTGRGPRRARNPPMIGRTLTTPLMPPAREPWRSQ